MPDPTTMILDTHQHFWQAARGDYHWMSPEVSVLCDHLSKPPIASGNLEPWKSLIAKVASHENVSCKLSGMVTEADHEHWTPEQLRPYIEHVVDVFGEDRVMFGSDWPVCTLAGSYGEVCHALRTVLDARLNTAAMKKVFCTNGARFYSITDRIDCRST